jgi:hypothetical protein
LRVCSTIFFLLNTNFPKFYLIDLEQHTSDPHKPQSQPSTGDIKIEYHPHSKRPPEIVSLEEYQVRRRKNKVAQRATIKRPWKPFQTRAEFEFAEVALKASLTKNQVDALIQVMKRCVDGEDKFEIHSHAHLCEIWNAGAVLHTAVGSI